MGYWPYVNQPTMTCRSPGLRASATALLFSFLFEPVTQGSQVATFQTFLCPLSLTRPDQMLKTA
jgi:hypothetical protein